MKLIDVIDILSDESSIKIGVNGDWLVTVTDKNYIEYRFLKLKVVSIYPSLSNGFIYLCIDLIDGGEDA